MKRTSKIQFGETEDGDKVFQYTLMNRSGMRVSLLNLGCTITEIITPDKDGKRDNIILGFDTLKEYLSSDNPYFGCIIGRVANRISNGSIQISGRHWELSKNHGNHHIHGGFKGFHSKIWDVNFLREEEHSTSVSMVYNSPHLEEGYPGNLLTTVTVMLNDDGTLSITSQAETDRDTSVNMTNHSYFNLAGNKGTSCLNHYLKLNADHFTEPDSELLPTGRISRVKNLPVDFNRSRTLGERISGKEYPMEHTKGYDHNYVLNTRTHNETYAAELYEPESGRVLRVYTTQPCMQLYTGNFIPENLRGKNKILMNPYSGVCLETQGYPDALNHNHFKSTLVSPAELYREKTEYRFSTRK